jgi:hypothetical protein
MKPRSSLTKCLFPKIHSSSHSCLPKFSTIFGIFPIISVTRISLLIYLNLEINFEWISFSFSFKAQPTRPRLWPWLSGRPKLPSPPPHYPAQCPPSLPVRWALPDFVLLMPSNQGWPHRLLACTAAMLEPPWPPPPLVQDPPPPSTIKPHPLPPLN